MNRISKNLPRNIVLGLIAPLLFLGGCEQAPSDLPATKTFLSLCPGFNETGKSPLVYGAECGNLSLPENPEDPSGNRIDIAVLRLPAISPVAKADPVFFIQGGPGGSSIDMAKQLQGHFADLRKNRDLIFVDQRGTGTSNPLDCAAAKFDAQQPEAEAIAQNLQRMRSCAEKYRDHIPYYTTPYAVADLDAVRQALGYATINLWGGSYGTRVALAYARAYPAAARSLVLDGVAPVAIALPHYFARDAMAALQAVNAECAALPECRAQFGDIVIKAERVSARLAKANAAGTPLIVSAPHPRHQQLETLSLTPRVFAQLIFMSLYSRDLTVLLPRALSEAEQGNYRLLAALSALAQEQSNDMNIAEAMHFSVVCNEDFVAAKNLVESAAPSGDFFGKNFVDDMAPICEFWPKAELPSDYFKPIVSRIPSLLLSGGRDPVTPVIWSNNVAQQLENATQLSARGGNHVVSTEGCLPQVIAQFIEQATMDNINTECVDKIKPLPLVLGANQKKIEESEGSQQP